MQNKLNEHKSMVEALIVQRNQLQQQVDKLNMQNLPTLSTTSIQLNTSFLNSNRNNKSKGKNNQMQFFQDIELEKNLPLLPDNMSINTI